MAKKERAITSINDVTAGLPGPWQRRDLVTVNDAVLRIVRLEGEFPWHHHDEDEMFLCCEGSFQIEWDGEEPIDFSAGDLVGVAAGRKHRPVANTRTHDVLMEKHETKQYGN